MRFRKFAQLCALCRSKIARISAGSARFIGSAAVVAAMLFAGPSAAVADGGLETQKGGLFHRKGWITPGIYARAPSRLGGPVASESRRSYRSERVRRSKSSAGARGRAAKRHERAAAKRRIPKRAISRREHKIAHSSGGRKRKQVSESVKVASLGVDLISVPNASGKRKQRPSVTGGSGRVQWVARSGCVPSRLRSAINYVARNFGRVRVNSTCRSRGHNRRVGGASRSMHLLSRAADFRVFGNIRQAARYLRGIGGGYKHYGGGLFHIDTGPRRTW